MAVKLVVLILFGAFCVNSVSTGKYSGHRVVRVTPKSVEGTESLVNFLHNATGLDVWRFPTKIDHSADIRFSEEYYLDAFSILTSVDYDVTVLIDDVQQLIDQQEIDRQSNHNDNGINGFKYSKYHHWKEIDKWLMNITKVRKDICSLVKVATSYEKRSLRALKINTNRSITKPAFWIQGGIHAREWISTATVLYVLGKMLDEYQHDKKIQTVLDKFEWYFLPVANPDGYSYAWNRDRMWRKTRSPHGCIGVDPNRNWDSHWCEYGAKRNPCSETYCGPHPFSEPEIKGIAEFITKKIPNVKAFMDLHSFSQYWMSPWGYTDDLPPDFKQQDEGSRLAVRALSKVHGTQYRYGSIGSIMFGFSSGTSTDWAYDKAGIKYSYAIELRDEGRFGFMLPEYLIEPTAEEFLQGLLALADYVSKN